MFRHLILGLLRQGETVHGYALMKAYAERSGIQIGASHFYRELQRLLLDGLVETAAREPNADARRAPYRITRLGVTAFDAWLCRPSTVITVAHEDEMSSRALLIGGARPAVAQHLLAAWQDDLWLRGKALERERDALLRRPQHSPRRFHPLPLLLTRRLKHVVADLEFLDDLRKANALPPTVGLPARPAAPVRTGDCARPADLHATALHLRPSLSRK